MRAIRLPTLALLLAGTVASAEAPLRYSHDEAFAIALQIAQAWPADMADPAGIQAAGHDVIWLDLGALSNSPLPGHLGADAPWFGTVFRMTLGDELLINCIRIPQARLAALREIDSLDAPWSSGDVGALQARLDALRPPADWFEFTYYRAYMTEVPVEAIAAQHCALRFPVGPGEIDPLPAILTDNFTDISPGFLSRPADSLTDHDLAFPPVTEAEGWRATGQTGDIALSWSLLFPDAIGASGTTPRILDLNITSWLAPMGS